MSKVNEQFEDAVRGRMRDLKELYGELFLLMEQSLQLEPEDEETSAASRELDRAITRMMTQAANRFEEYREYMRRNSAGEAELGAGLREELHHFESRLQSGLQALLERVQERSEEVRDRRDDVREKLNEIQGKKRTRRAYRGPGNSPSSLIDSNV